MVRRHTHCECVLKLVEYADGLEAALDEAIEVLELSDPGSRRAKYIHAPEDALVGQLCETWGYGAVMDAASRLWRLKDPVGAQTNGACVATVQRALNIARSALSPKPEGET